MYDILVTALQTLAGVCDGAIKDDRMGFNGRDTRFGHELAELSLKRKLSDGQQTAAIKMLQIYRTQLKSYGIELPTITEYAQITTALPRRELQPRVTKVTVSASQYAFIVSFPYNAALVAAIKTLPRRKWDNPTKSWLVPADCYDELVAVLEGREVEWDVEARSLVDRTGRARIASTAQEAEIDVPNLTGALLPFQKAGVRFLEINRGHALIGDEMGLGKTIQAIAFLALHPELRPAVVVCPASLKANWRKEMEKWLTPQANKRTLVLSGTKPYDLFDQPADIFIVNYDILDPWLQSLCTLEPAVLICDEAHYLKSRDSIRTKAVKELSEFCGRTILMTGTPLLNRPIELFPLLNILRPTEWNSYMAFAKRYCAAKQRTVGGKKMPKRTIWDVSGASNLSELHNKLRTLMVRRLKSIVMQELPDKRRVIVPMEIDLADYDTFIERTTDELERAGNRAAQMVIIEKARQYVLEQKINHCAAWIGDFLQSGEKLLVFTWHKATAAVLKELFPHAVALTGESSQAEREHAVEAFQKDEKVKLFIGNIAAAGVGLTLTAASNVAFVEMGWRPGDQTQAEDRTHRYGQKNAVTAYYLLAEQTIEEDMYKLLEKKRVVTETVTDGAASDFGFNTNHVAHDLIDLLLEKKKDKKK